MSELKVELCPETGICSLIKADGKKVDLMPDEVSTLRDAEGNADAIKAVLSEVDSSFAESLDSDEVTKLSSTLR